MSHIPQGYTPSGFCICCCGLAGIGCCSNDNCFHHYKELVAAHSTCWPGAVIFPLPPGCTCAAPWPAKHLIRCCFGAFPVNLLHERQYICVAPCRAVPAAIRCSCSAPAEVHTQGDRGGSSGVPPAKTLLQACAHQRGACLCMAASAQPTASSKSMPGSLSCIVACRCLALVVCLAVGRVPAQVVTANRHHISQPCGGDPTKPVPVPSWCITALANRQPWFIDPSTRHVCADDSATGLNLADAGPVGPTTTHYT